MDDPVWVRTTPSPTGELTLVVARSGVRAVLWDADESDDVLRERCDDPAPPEVAAVLDATCAQLDEYFAGRRSEFDLPLDPRGTPFQLEAWRALRTIPYGETVSYGEQAARLGDARKARAVGAANGRNPIPIIVPCHRVVGADGSLTGFAGGLAAKAWLLAHERGEQQLL